MKTPCLAIVLLAATFLSCKKHVISPPVNQLSLLPPATQTGANTFGCLVNGQAFLPAGNILAVLIQCNYVYTQGGYHLTVAANDNSNSHLYKTVLVGTDSLAIKQGAIYELKSFTSGNAIGTYSLFPEIGVLQYGTTNTVGGNLIITKFDSLKQIVSGTFTFNAIDAKDDTVKITNGRFDMRYTQ